MQDLPPIRISGSVFQGTTGGGFNARVIIASLPLKKKNKGEIVRPPRHFIGDDDDDDDDDDDKGWYRIGPCPVFVTVVVVMLR